MVHQNVQNERPEAYKFDEQLEVAIIAETYFIECSKAKQAAGLITSFEDVRDSPYYQDQDIDFIWNYPDGRKLKIEVKGDTFETNNIFAELVVPSFYIDPITKNVIGTSAKLGWLYGSKADIIFYCFINAGDICFLNLRRFSNWITKNITSSEIKRKGYVYSPRAAKNISDRGSPYYGVGLLVPLQDIINANPQEKFLKLNKEPHKGDILAVYKAKYPDQKENASL